jgi:XTP/dITP diphosphohydrolase
MKIIFTTTNKYKIQAAESVLNKYGIEVVGKEVEVDEIQSDSPEEVILDKVKKCCSKIKKPLIAMDSGLFIEDLGGFPGVYTKFVLKTIGEDGLMKLTKEFKNNKAYVQRIIGYTDGKVLKTFSSRGYGKIIQEKRGTNGMNYDLVFYVPSKKKTLAELDLPEQVKVWGDAWDKLAKYLKSRNKKNGRKR